MNSKLELIREKRAEIKAIVARRKGISISIFGSVARGEESPESDIDFLVQFSKDASLFDMGGLQVELSELLGMNVDVVSIGGLRARDSHILKESIEL